MKTTDIKKFQKRLKELFSEIKDVPAKDKVKIKTIVVGELTKKTVNLTQARTKKVSISSRVLKHIYERRPGDIKIVLEKIPLAICVPDEILFNIKTLGTVFFIKNHKKLFATLVEIDVCGENNEVVTAFLTSRRYLKKFGRPGRSDVPPSTTKMWSASDQKISALQATKTILTKKQGNVKLNISIIIPNYNGKDLLAQNLPKVINETMKQCSHETVEFIVVDDGSTDGSVEFIKELKSSRVKRLKNSLINNSLINNKLIIKLIENEKNLGFSSTVNRGVKSASGEIVILLNTDVYPEEGFLDAVLPHFKDPKVFAVGMLDKSIENGEIVRRGRGLAEWRRGFLVHWRGKANKKDTFWVFGGSGVFRKSIWEKLGGFDPDYNPFYWEDIDLSFRARKDGYKILFEPKSAVFHEHKKGAIKRQFPSWKIRSISFRNQFLFVWKNANLTQLLSHLLWLPYHIIKSILTGDICFIIGLLWAIKRRLTFRR